MTWAAISAAVAGFFKALPKIAELLDRLATAIERSNEQRTRIHQEQLELEAGRLRIQMEMSGSDIERQAINRRISDLERRFSK